MTKKQLIDKIIASKNFQWRGYADKYHLHGRSSDETIDNIELHLLRQPSEVINMMFECNCDDEVQNHYAETYGYFTHSKEYEDEALSNYYK